MRRCGPLKQGLHVLTPSSERIPGVQDLKGQRVEVQAEGECQA